MIAQSKIDSALYAASLRIAEEIAERHGTHGYISVIVPCFNAESYIEPCLESLAAQTLDQDLFEVICVDDCSTDSTVEKIESFRGKLKNLRIICHDINRKQGAARNTGVAAATGNYITFLDCDDFLRMDALELLLSHAQDGAEVVVSQLIKVRYDIPYAPRGIGRKIEGDIKLSTLQNKLGWFPVSMLMLKSLIVENSIKFREGVYFEDIDFCIKVFLNCVNCKVIPDQLYYYVQRDSSTVNFMSEKKLSDSVAAMAECFSLISGHKEYEAVFRITANSWLRLQAARIRDGQHAYHEKLRLSSHFVEEISRLGLEVQFSSEQIKEITDISKEERRTPSEIDPKKNSKVCSQPWGSSLEIEFSEKIIFFCEVDYHIRTAAPIARALEKLGVETLIVDASRSTSFSTNRPMSEFELDSYSDLNIRQFNVAEKLPFSTKALGFVFLNDLTYTSKLVFENFGFGVPTFGFYEGINDDWNLDRDHPRRPYRTCDHLLLPGIYQAAFYRDREFSVVGLPNVRTRLAKDVMKPVKRRAVINVNFTYGVLEERRDIFVQSAIEGCKIAGLDYVISQHPADKADLTQYNLSTDSIYNLIDENSILISRFSTIILESLAAGRPVVYHNPISELVPKFKSPMGAFPISYNASQLAKCLKQELDYVHFGGNVRDKASLFLHAHCSPYSIVDTSERAANAIIDVLNNGKNDLTFKHGRELYRTRPRVNKKNSDTVVKFSSGVVRIKESDLAAQLLLDPVATLPRLEAGGDLARPAAALAAANDAAGAHFRAVLDWARARTKATG